MWTQKGERRVRQTGTLGLSYTHHHVSNRRLVGSRCIAGGAQLGALNDPDGGMGAGGDSRRRHMCAYGWFMLLCSRNEYNIVMQLYSTKK